MSASTLRCSVENHVGCIRKACCIRYVHMVYSDEFLPLLLGVGDFRWLDALARSWLCKFDWYWCVITMFVCVRTILRNLARATYRTYTKSKRPTLSAHGGQDPKPDLCSALGYIRGYLATPPH